MITYRHGYNFLDAATFPKTSDQQQIDYHVTPVMIVYAPTRSQVLKTNGTSALIELDPGASNVGAARSGLVITNCRRLTPGDLRGGFLDYHLRFNLDINPLTANSFNLNFHPLEVVSR